MAEIPLVDLLEEMERLDYPNRLQSRPGGRIHCDLCGADTPAEQWTIGKVRRVEGETDPSAEVIVLGLVGPPGPCGCRGSIVLGYGPAASRDDADVLERLNAPSARGRAVVDRESAC